MDNISVEQEVVEDVNKEDILVSNSLLCIGLQILLLRARQTVGSENVRMVRIKMRL